MCFYTILSMCIGINKKYPLITSCIILLIVGGILGRYHFLGKPNALFLEFFLGIIIGYIIREYYMHIERYKKIATFVCITLTICLFYRYRLNMFSAGLILLVFIIQESVFVRFKKLSAVLSHLGDISYSTYLVHVIVIGWLYHIFGNNNSLAMELLILLLLSSIVYLISVVSFKYVENAEWINKFKTKISKAYPVPIPVAVK